MNLQAPIKNMQELAKEGGEESEAKLGKQLRYYRGPPPPSQAIGETSGEQFFRSTDISFWIRVRSMVALAGENQFRRSCLFLFLIACAKHMSAIAAGTRL